MFKPRPAAAFRALLFAALVSGPWHTGSGAPLTLAIGTPAPQIDTTKSG